MARLTRSAAAASAAVIQQGTATGFQDALVGVRYRLLGQGSRALALGLQWSGPSGYNRHLDSLGIRLGDGQQQIAVEISGGAARPGSRFFQLSLGGSYRFLSLTKRDDGDQVVDPAHPARHLWSQHLVGTADVGVWVRPSLLVGGRFRGKFSLGAGALVEEIDQALAGGVLLYRIDPSLDMFGGFWSTAAGKHTLHFDQVYLGLGFHRTKTDRLEGFLSGTQTP